VGLVGAAVSALLGGCTALPGRPAADAAADAVTGPVPGGPSGIVLVTVRNRPAPIPVLAASGVHGYDVVPGYREGEQARAAVEQLAARYHLRLVDEWPIQALHVHCVLFHVGASDSRGEVLARLAQDPAIELAQPLQTFQTYSSAYNDPYFGLQRGLARISAADAQVWTRGEGVRVAVIDTGLDAAHPDLSGRVELVRNFVDGNAGQFASDRHGTEVAGVIAADANNHEGIVGVAPEARILALKACWQLDARSDAAQCNSFTLAKAIAIAIESGARVINLSLGGPPDALLSQLVEYALSRGVIVIGAVPPDGRVEGFPVGVAGVIAVDSVERPDRERAGGADRALRAPGREVLTLTPGGHYDFVSGSSLAAAHVSGAVALLLSEKGGLDSASIYGLLRRTSLAGPDGSEAINVCAAVVALRSSGSCPQPPSIGR
jgi:hypothetical protein